MASATDHSAPKALSKMPAGTTPMNPEMPLMSDSLELACTSSASLPTTAGTRALRATWYDFWPTSRHSASRKNTVLSPVMRVMSR